MRLVGPDSYVITFSRKQFKVLASDGSNVFRGMASGRGAKLYVFSSNGHPIYVGVTIQKIRNRLRYGWQAQGRGGYYGYAFRKHLAQAALDIWYLEPRRGINSKVDLETIEAELVFLIRKRGQWPMFQTEIHFHQSDKEHRNLAAEVLRHYDRVPTPRQSRRR